MPEYALHKGDDGHTHYCDRHDPEMRWLCGKGAGGSVQRQDVDAPLCDQCREHFDGGRDA